MYANEPKHRFYSRLGDVIQSLHHLLSRICFCFYFFHSHVHAITAAQWDVTGVTRFPLVSAAISSKSGMSSELLQWETLAFGNPWAITGVGEAWSAVRGWSVTESRALPELHEGRLTDLSKASTWHLFAAAATGWLPLRGESYIPCLLIKFHCHMFNRREATLQVG